MSLTLPVAVETNTSKPGRISMRFAIRNRFVLSLLSICSDALLSVSDANCSTSDGSDGGLSSYIVATGQDQMGMMGRHIRKRYSKNLYMNDVPTSYGTASQYMTVGWKRLCSSPS